MNGDVFTRELASWVLFVVVSADAPDQVLHILGPGDTCTPAGPAALSNELTGVLASVAHSLERHLPQSVIYKNQADAIKPAAHSSAP